ncbi:MAG: hypothetical protein JSS97_16530, partial [Actinobacteria bacterium]|nr:hypothetical protein [Actinomycetota bacterium]
AERPAASPRRVACAWLRIEDEPRRAAAAVRPEIEHWLEGGLYPEPPRRAGVPLPPQSERDFEALTQELAAAGDPPRCAAAIARLAEAGADAIVLVPVGADPLGQVERLAAEVLPAPAIRSRRSR